MTEKSKAKQIAVEETGRVLEETVQKTLENVNRDIDSIMGGGSAVIMLNAVEEAAYTVQRRDMDKIVRLTNDSERIIVRAPSDSAANMPLYTSVGLMQGANQTVEVLPDTGVFLEAPTGRETYGQGDIRILYKRAPNVWVLV